MSHFVPEATLKPIRLQCMPKIGMQCLRCKCAGRLFQTRGPAAAKLLSPYVVCAIVMSGKRTICLWTSRADV